MMGVCDVTPHRQGWDLYVEHRVPDAGTWYDVRIRVHHDTSYPEQSSARAEVWSHSTMAWHEIETLATPIWAGAGELDDRTRRRNTMDERGGTVAAWSAHDELIERATRLLKGA